MNDELNLGDLLLNEYIAGTSKNDILSKFNIDDTMYSMWEKINKLELKKIDAMLEKRKLRQLLKIKNVPHRLESSSSSECDESDSYEEDSEYENRSHKKSQYLHKEPKNYHVADQIINVMEQKTIETEKLIQLNALKIRQNEIQEKINKFIDLDSQKKIGKIEFTRVTTILSEDLNNIKQQISGIESTISSPQIN